MFHCIHLYFDGFDLCSVFDGLSSVFSIFDEFDSFFLARECGCTGQTSHVPLGWLVAFACCPVLSLSSIGHSGFGQRAEETDWSSGREIVSIDD